MSQEEELVDYKADSQHEQSVSAVLSEKENSSLHGDLTSVSSLGSSKFDMEDTSELDELLQRQHLKTGGLMGLLERLPLFVKLFLMLLIAMIGVVAVGIFITVREATVVSKVRNSRHIGLMAQQAGQLVHELQRERTFFFVYTISNGSKYATELIDKVKETDFQLNNFKRMRQSLDSRTKTFRAAFLQQVATLDNLRTRAYAFQATPNELFDYYANCSRLLDNFIRSFTYNAESASRSISNLNTFLVLKEHTGLIRVQVAWAIQLGYFTDSNYRNFYYSVLNEAEKIDFFTSGSSREILDKYNEIMSPIIPPVTEVVNFMLTRPSNTSSEISYDAWWTTATAKSDAMLKMTNFILEEIERVTKRELSKSSTRIAIIIFFCTLLVVLSIISAFVFSMAITGPWRRIIEVQENTIKKFVPKGFLRILKCYRLSDLTLGKYVERDLTIMLVDIVDFSKMSDRLSPQQSVTVINNYLAKIGPIIRKNSGYIDKFMGTKIMACFPTALAGLKTAIEIQELMARSGFDSITSGLGSSETFKYNIAVSIHTGKVIVAAIGEHERMEGSIQGDVVTLCNRLLSLCKAFHVRILSSHETMKRLRNPSELPYRPLGYIHSGKSQNTMDQGSKLKLYEILERTLDQSKIQTSKEVKEATGLLSNHDADQALLILDSILTRHPEDYALSRVRDSCIITLQYESERLKRMQVHDALRSDVIRDSFAQFCSEERSEENIKFWIACDEYRQLSDDIKRIITTKQLYNDYLTPKSKYRVNTSDESIKKVCDHIQQYDLNLVYPPTNLFDSLQVEIEILMDDTFRRFKTNSSLFRKAFKKTLPTPLVHLTVEDLLL